MKNSYDYFESRKFRSSAQIKEQIDSVLAPAQPDSFLLRGLRSFVFNLNCPTTRGYTTPEPHQCRSICGRPARFSPYGTGGGVVVI